MAALGRLAARVRNAGQLNLMAAAKAWAGTSDVTCPASWRQKFSEYESRAGFATKPRGLLGFLGKDGIFPSGERRPAPGNDYGVDTRERSDDEDMEEELRPSLGKHRDLVSVAPEEAKSDVKAVTETAMDKGSSVATSALDNVGDILTKTGLEVNLDVSLQELSIEKLVLKDLGLVLVIKTKPPPTPGPPPAPEPEPQPPL